MRSHCTWKPSRDRNGASSPLARASTLAYVEARRSLVFARYRPSGATVYPVGMAAIALTIAGSDPSGGAGIQADLKTFHQFGVYGQAVITLLTVQNTVRVSRVEVVSPALVLEQIQAVVEDIPPGAAKTGALGSAAMVETVACAAAHWNFPLVVD